jgi:hypothetical protein
MPAPSRLTSILPRENPRAIRARDECRSETLAWLAADDTVEPGEVCDIPCGGGTGTARLREPPEPRKGGRRGQQVLRSAV